MLKELLGNIKGIHLVLLVCIVIIAIIIESVHLLKKPKSSVTIPAIKTAPPCPPKKTPGGKPNVLFVCAGNTCRSAMADIYANYVCKGKFNIDSAGVSASAGGRKMTPRAQEVLYKVVGIPYSISGKHISKKLSQDLLQWADYILTMESVEEMLEKNVKNWHCFTDKVSKTVCDGLSILDPWYDTDKPYAYTTYCETFKLIKQCVDKFLTTTKPKCSIEPQTLLVSCESYSFWGVMIFILVILICCFIGFVFYKAYL